MGLVPPKTRPKTTLANGHRRGESYLLVLELGRTIHDTPSNRGKSRLHRLTLRKKITVLGMVAVGAIARAFLFGITGLHNLLWIKLAR